MSCRSPPECTNERPRFKRYSKNFILLSIAERHYHSNLCPRESSSLIFGGTESIEKCRNSEIRYSLIKQQIYGQQLYVTGQEGRLYLSLLVRPARCRFSFQCCGNPMGSYFQALYVMEGYHESMTLRLFDDPQFRRAKGNCNKC